MRCTDSNLIFDKKQDQTGRHGTGNTVHHKNQHQFCKLFFLKRLEQAKDLMHLSIGF